MTDNPSIDSRYGSYRVAGKMQASCLIFTYQDAQGAPHIMLSQADPRWRVTTALKYLSDKDSYSLPVPPAMFPGGYADADECEKQDDAFTQRRTFITEHMSNIRKDSHEEMCALAALREAEEETGLAAYMLGKSMRSVTTICPYDDLEIHAFHVDAGCLTEAEEVDLKKSIKAQDDTLTARLVPTETLSRFTDEAGKTRYQIEGYNPLQCMREFTDPSTADIKKLQKPEHTLWHHFAHQRKHTHYRFLLSESLQPDIELNANNGAIVEEILKYQSLPALKDRPRSSLLYLPEEHAQATPSATTSHSAAVAAYGGEAKSAGWAL